MLELEGRYFHVVRAHLCSAEHDNEQIGSRSGERSVVSANLYYNKYHGRVNKSFTALVDSASIVHEDFRIPSLASATKNTAFVLTFGSRSWPH